MFCMTTNPYENGYRPEIEAYDAEIDERITFDRTRADRKQAFILFGLAIGIFLVMLVLVGYMYGPCGLEDAMCDFTN